MLTKQQVSDIQNKLIQNISINVLKNEYNLTHQMIYDISNGKSYYNETLDYPLHKKRIRQIHFCPDCGKKINHQSRYCKSCAIKHKHAEFMDYKNLYQQDIINIIDYIVLEGFEQATAHYKVCRKTIRNFLKENNCPVYKKDLQDFYKIIHNIIDEPSQRRSYTSTGESGKNILLMINPQNNNIEKSFLTCTDAAIFLGDRNKNKHISSAAAGSRKTAYGYIWKYQNKTA